MWSCSAHILNTVFRTRGSFRGSAGVRMGIWLGMLLAGTLGAAPYHHDPKTIEEFRPRDGLPNFFAKLKAGGPVRIAYLGGSITEANGWRPKTLAWLKGQYPKAEIIEINAAISGTGSDYGACRLQGDVLAKDPDLVFLECRVNGGAGYEKQSVEGIVWQIWTKNPRIDICFVYTTARYMMQSHRAGRSDGFGAVMEGIANAYGIPSIDLAVEVVRREKEGTLIFSGDAPVEGKLVFSKDGVHPGDAGHDLYRDVIARSMLTIKDGTKATDHALPTALEQKAWEVATLLPISQVALSAGWTKVDGDKDAVYTEDRRRTANMLRGAVKCDKVGETITVKWNGTTVGFSDIPYGQPHVMEAVIDGGKPITFQRRQTEARKYSRFWYLPEQIPGEHTVTMKIKELPSGQWAYEGQVLIVGKPLP
jgi:hypothetical protein